MINTYSPLELLGAFAICVGVGYAGRWLQEQHDKKVAKNAVNHARSCPQPAA